MARLLVLLLATFAFAAPARAGGKTKAKPPTLTIGPPIYKFTVDRAKVALFPDSRRTHMVLTLALSTTATERPHTTRSNELELTLPDTARVVGLALTVGTRQRLVGKPEVGCAAATDPAEGSIVCRDAWQRFVKLKYDDVDTALLRFQYAADGIAHYDVHFSPLLQGAPVTVEIEIELQPARQLDVASGSAVRDYVVEIDSVAQKVKPLAKGYKAQRIALPKPKPHDTATDALISNSIVRDGVSLLVDSPSPKP
jgi:hypothetical protein